MRRKTHTQKRGIPELLFGPAIFVVLGAAYVTLGTLSSLDPVIAQSNPIIGTTLVSYLVFIAGLLSFCLGIATARHALKLWLLPLGAGLFIGIIALSNALGVHPVISAAINLGALLSSYVLMKSPAKWEWVFAAGACMFWLNFAANGMPALDMSMHAELLRIVNPVFMSGFLLMTYSAAMMHPARRALWIFIIASLLLSTFRLYAGIALLTWMILEAGCRKKESASFKWTAMIAASSVLVFVLFVFTGQTLMAQDNGGWELGPLQTLEHRLAFTVSVFDDITQLSFPWGYSFGGSLSMESTEYTCRLLYGYGERITSTTFGEAMLNFGIPAVLLIGWFAGAVLTNLRRVDYKIYAILLATVIATLDVGINAFVLMELAYFGWLRLFICKGKEPAETAKESAKAHSMKPSECRKAPRKSGKK